MPYKITDENNVPQELLNAREQNKCIQCMTVIGWIDIDDPEFRVGNIYRVKEEN